MGWSQKGLDQQDHQRRKEHTENRYAGGSGAKYLTEVIPSYVPREGQNKIRIVEPIELDDLGWYSIEVAFHRNVGFDRSYYLCNHEMKIGACYHKELQTSELWETDPDMAKGYFPDRRTLMLVLDLLGDDPHKLMKWSCPNGLADEIVNQCHEPETDTYRNPADPETGPPIFYTRTGTGLHTKYTGVKIGTQPMPLTDHHANQRVEFTELIIVPEYEVVKAAFLNEQHPPARVTEPGPPPASYEEDMQRQTADQKYAEPDTPPPPPPGNEAAPPPPPSTQTFDPTADAIKTTSGFLASLDRDGLKRVKVAHKAQFDELTFAIYKTTADAEIAQAICNTLINHGYRLTDIGELEPIQNQKAQAEPELEAEVELETEPDIPLPPPPTGAGGANINSAQPPAVAGAGDREKTDVKNALAAAISNRQNS